MVGWSLGLFELTSRTLETTSPPTSQLIAISYPHDVGLSLVVGMSHLVGKMAQNNNTKKTIVFLHPDLGIGGAERLVVDAAVGLQNRGHKVVVFTSHCDPGHCFEEARDGMRSLLTFVSGFWRASSFAMSNSQLPTLQAPSMSASVATPSCLHRSSRASASSVLSSGKSTSFSRFI